MKNIIFSIWSDLKTTDHISAPDWKQESFRKFKHKLVERQKEYAKHCGAEYFLFEAKSTDYVDVQFDKILKFEELTKGLAASPGAASGRVALDAQTAVELSKKGKRVILVTKETSPDDIHGMAAAHGLLTARGGRTSHAAVVGRQMGKVCVVGAEEIKVDMSKRIFSVDKFLTS